MSRRIRWRAAVISGYLAGLRPGRGKRGSLQVLPSDHQTHNTHAEKTDPFAFTCEIRRLRPPWSGIYAIMQWQDGEWMASRGKRHRLDEPPSRFTRCISAPGCGLPNEEDALADLPGTGDPDWPNMSARWASPTSNCCRSCEHPFDGSWGYQTRVLCAHQPFRHAAGFQVSSSTTCHQHGIGVILDWVPAHFPTDAHGLGYFDGTHLYEHADPRRASTRTGAP